MKNIRCLVTAVVFSLLCCATGDAQSIRKDLLELADAERAFAAFTVKEGFRTGFIKYFADDGIGFGPHPERTKEVLGKRPAEGGPRTLIFDWAPIFGDISAAGDMGYTTGPVLFTPQGPNAKPPWHGTYFSVWEKQTDGAWKVAVDMGVDTPSAVAPLDGQFVAAKVTSRRAGATSDLANLDKRLSDALSDGDAIKVYKSTLDAQFRVHRKGIMPVTDLGALSSAIEHTSFEYLGGRISKSRDLAFTYGKYRTTNNGVAEEGYYVHVWRPDATGQWRLAVDVQSPLKQN